MTKGFGTHKGTRLVRHVLLPAGKMVWSTEMRVRDPPKGCECQGCEFRRGGANNTPRSHLPKPHGWYRLGNLKGLMELGPQIPSLGNLSHLKM